MPKPNVNFRTREIGWWFGTTQGSNGNVGGGGQSHGGIFGAALPANTVAKTTPVQLPHALLGGASAFSRGSGSPALLEKTRAIQGAFGSHCVYLEISAHLRSAANVDLPGIVRIYHNDYWPLPAAVPGVPITSDLGDWVTNGGGFTTGWQEWEEWSPLTIPTPPPGFTSLGNFGIRYEYRRKLGKAPANFFFLTCENVGSVAATEWGVGLFLR